MKEYFKTNIKNIVLSVLLFVIYYCGISVLSRGMGVLNQTQIDIEYRPFNLISAIYRTAGFFIIPFIFFFLLWYKNNSISASFKDLNTLNNVIIPIIGSCIIYYIIGLLSKFTIILFIPIYIYSLLITGEIFATTIQNEYFGTLNIAFLIYIILMSISSFVGFKIGVMRRGKSRKKLMANKKD
jgi:hypothetical protein